MIGPLVIAFGVVMFATAAFANDKPFRRRSGKGEGSAYRGCEGGTFERGAGGTGVLEVNDAKCKGMQYDLKFDSAYKLISMTRD